MKFSSEFRGMGPGMTLGIQMVVVTLVGTGIGYWLDGATGRGPLFLVLFFFLGALGGIASRSSEGTDSATAHGPPGESDANQTALSQA